MSKRSEQFESDCTKYLNKKYGNLKKFYHLGKSDSKKPDIEIPNKFYIEVKLCPAQCGQFVLLPDIKTKSFVFSNKNDSTANQYTDIIEKHMNNDFESFKDAGTSGKEIIFDGCKEIFSNWIVTYYKNKNVKYFITNEYIIIPVERFSSYFNVTAKYRVKRSGSSSVGKSNQSAITDYIIKNYNLNSFLIKNDKIFVKTNLNMHGTRFVYDKYEYMFSLRDDKYEIRKLSNTFNANVIFSIDINSQQDYNDLKYFENDLQ